MGMGLMMNREIKFRAWDGEVGRMSIPYHVSSPIIQWSDGDIDMPSAFACGGDDRFRIEQYTGLNDKNGVEIYEGDIVSRRGWETQPDGSQILAPKYETQTPVLVEYRTRTPFLGFALLDHDVVIGNIHENPELLA